MIVASTIVPVAIFSPLAARCRRTSSNSWRPRSCSSIRWAKAAHRGLAGHRLAPQVDPDKTPHRQRIVECLLHRRVRQVEPLLQKINAQHPLHPDRRAAIARLGINWLDQPAQRCPRNHPFHLRQEQRPPRRLGVPLKPRRRQRQLLHPPTHARQSTPLRIISRSLEHGFCRGSLGLLSGSFSSVSAPREELTARRARGGRDSGSEQRFGTVGPAART